MGETSSSALVGFNAGSRNRSETIPHSLTTSIINITRTSNVGIPGMWIFQVNGEEIEAPNVGMFHFLLHNLL